jgi:uncharacterized membrane protein HdeD (DUF308 family)
MQVIVIDMETLVRNWWLIALRGVAAVLFGLCTFFAPEISLTALVLLFGAYALVDGVFAIAAALRGRGSNETWWLLILEGIAGIATGIVTALWPGITALALLYVIAIWAVITGGLEIAAAVRLRKVITHEWLLGLAGLASIVFGALLLLFPGPGALAVVFWIGAYALVSGSLLLALGIRLRLWQRPQARRHAAHAAA